VAPLGFAANQQSSSSNAERSQHQQQPPRPESRSDSFARADALLREHRHHQLQSGVINSVSNDHSEQKQIIAIQEYATSSRNSRPESRNRVTYQSVGSYSSTSSNDQVDAGLLAVVDQPDPLVSLIQSLAEISPIRASPSMTKTENEHPGGSNTIAAATISTSVPSNNVTNCSSNQSPKAWQNCTQVCLPFTQIPRVHA